MKIALVMGDKAVESKCYGNLGLDYFSLGDFNKAVEYYEKSLEITKVIGDIVVEAESYRGIGLIHFKKNEFDEALKEMRDALNIFRKTGSRVQEVQTHIYISIILSKLNNPEYLDEARKVISIAERLEETPLTNLIKKTAEELIKNGSVPDSRLDEIERLG